MTRWVPSNYTFVHNTQVSQKYIERVILTKKRRNRIRCDFMRSSTKIKDVLETKILEGHIWKLANLNLIALTEILVRFREKTAEQFFLEMIIKIGGHI